MINLVLCWALLGHIWGHMSCVGYAFWNWNGTKGPQTLGVNSLGEPFV